MKKKVAFLLTIFSMGFLMTQVVQAHHSFSQFDRNVQKVVSGTVTKWAFNNPHVWIHLDEVNAEGETTSWSFEGAGLVPLIKKGINGNTIQPGDQVTMMYCPLRDGRPGGAIGWIIKNDEPMITPNDGGCWVTEEMQEQWMEWLEQGITSNIEGEAA